MATKTEDGKAFPASDYCYVPDPESPSTWKLRTTSTPGGDPDPGIVGAAAAALGAGFRGNRVQLPADARAGVVACVRRAWTQAHPDLTPADMPPALRTRAADLEETFAEPLEDELEARSYQLGPEEIEVRDAAKREVDVRLLPWGQLAETKYGPEEFARGAFDEAKPEDVYLYGPEHAMTFGVGQGGEPKMVRVPIGRAKELSNRDDGQHATFRVARTAAGDEALALMADKIISGVSVEFAQLPGGTQIQTRAGRRVRIHTRARLVGATPTHKPAYGDQAAVLAVRSQQQEEPPMGEVQAPEGAAVQPDAAQLDMIQKAFDQIEARAAAQDAINQKFLERMERADEQYRASFEIPNPLPESQQPKLDKGQWAQLVLKLLTGERIPQEQMRTIDDVITADNAGVVPPAYLTELIGIIDASRPFASTTRRLPTPSAGMKLIVPVIEQRPEVAVQSGGEKHELASRTTKIGTTDFDAVTIGGVADLSLQILKRSSPEFLTLWLELLAEAYAIEAEDQLILALADSIGGFGGASSLDPADLSLGDAYVAAFDAIRRPPDTIWLSTQAVGEFIDAKATTTNAPLYSNITASATAAGGITGTISGLRAVHVPTLDAHGAYAIVGPSSGFAWAEDGTYTLQVDVPAKAGRDVALVSILWPAPWYPAAFTAYNVKS